MAHDNSDAQLKGITSGGANGLQQHQAPDTLGGSTTSGPGARNPNEQMNSNRMYPGGMLSAPWQTLIRNGFKRGTPKQNVGSVTVKEPPKQGLGTVTVKETPKPQGFGRVIQKALARGFKVGISPKDAKAPENPEIHHPETHVAGVEIPHSLREHLKAGNVIPYDHALRGEAAEFVTNVWRKNTHDGKRMSSRLLGVTEDEAPQIKPGKATIKDEMPFKKAVEARKKSRMNPVKTYTPEEKVEKADLEKGVMRRIAPFNPAKDVQAEDKAALHDWQTYMNDPTGIHDFNTDPGVAREGLSEMHPHAKLRAMHRLHGMVQTRRNPGTGEREFLLHRGASKEEAGNSIVGNQAKYSERSSWTADPLTAQEFGAHPYWSNPDAEGEADEPLQPGGVITAWIPESKVAHIPRHYGDIRNERRLGENNYSKEHEVIVEPHQFEVHSFLPHEQIPRHGVHPQFKPQKNKLALSEMEIYKSNYGPKYMKLYDPKANTERKQSRTGAEAPKPPKAAPAPHPDSPHAQRPNQRQRVKDVKADLQQKLAADPSKAKVSLSTTNSKLAKDGIASFNLVPIETCPGAGSCAKYCYADTGSFLRFWKTTMPPRVANWLASQKPDFVEKMNAMFGDVEKKGKIKVIRVHDSGDFYSPDYIKKWTEIARPTRS